MYNLENNNKTLHSCRSYSVYKPLIWSEICVEFTYENEIHFCDLREELFKKEEKLWNPQREE